MKNNNNEININRYINGELKGKDLTAFKALLQQDKTLQKKINLHKDVDAILYEKMAPVKTFKKEEAELEPLLAKLGDEFILQENQIDKQTTETVTEPQKQAKPGLVKRLFPIVGLAAAAAILLFLFIPKQQNKLFAKHFKLPTLQTKMSPSDDLTTFDKANKAYKSKNYKEAVVLYNQSLKEDLNNPKALLYKGGAELELNKGDAALNTFKQLANSHPKYANITNWYIALSHLKKGDQEKAKSTLKLITKEDKEYYNKAQQLLKEI